MKHREKSDQIPSIKTLPGDAKNLAKPREQLRFLKLSVAFPEKLSQTTKNSLDS